MILRPLESNLAGANREREPVPAWEAIAERQKNLAAGYWLISQPDHANLAGELAARFVSNRFPAVNAQVARAIALHDSGWAMFPQESNPSTPPRLCPNGKPLAFVEFGPREFLQAWSASIDHAAGVCAAGGIIVSRHFCELGSFRLENSGDLDTDDRHLIETFLHREQERRQGLLAACSSTAAELDGLLEVLKFCDLLSLYLCSGALSEAEFPQKLTDRPVRISHSTEEDLYRLNPSPFQKNGEVRPVSMSVSARSFPGEARPTTLRFVLC